MLSNIEPKNFDEEGKYINYIDAMNKELDQIENNMTWELTR